MDERFEWDPSKERTNIGRHGVSFVEAQLVFEDPLHVMIEDPDHSEYEQRFVVLGCPAYGTVLVVTCTHRDDRIRIINARPATPAEKRRYMNEDLSEIHDEDDFMRDEYDFSNGVRGGMYTGPRGLVLMIPIDPELQPYFHETKDVNDALRMLVAEGRYPKIESEEWVEPETDER